MGTMKLEKINKIYPNGVQAVYDFSMEIQEGEFIVFVGPSGCGKSTTLRMIAGLEEISSGTLSLDGKVINDSAPKDRDIAMVFQNYALYSHMTVYHNMAFSLVLRKEDSDLIHQRVMWAADMLGLVPYLNRKPAQLSGGQRQRVAVGRAIVRNPKIFLLDEPLSNLDAKLRSSMRKELKTVQHRLNTTMIYVTHDQIEALTLADRIVILKEGRIQQIGTPYEIYHDPKNLFVATFMGTPPMNVFKVKVSEQGRLILGENVVDLTGHSCKNCLESAALFGKEVFIGVRPEDMIVEKKQGEPTPNDTRISIFELLGSDALVHFNIGESSVIAKIIDQGNLAENDAITYVFAIEKLYFFDVETGRRIYVE